MIDFAQQTLIEQQRLEYELTVQAANRAERFNNSMRLVHGSHADNPAERLGTCYPHRNKDSLPFETIDDANGHQHLGWLLYENCGTIKHLVQALIAAVTGGREIHYRIRRRENDCFTAELDEDSINCQIADTQAANDWQAVLEESILREYTFGGVLRQAQPKNDDVIVRFRETTCLTNSFSRVPEAVGLTVNETQQRAKFGILYDLEELEEATDTTPQRARIDFSEPLWYFLLTELHDGKQTVEAIPASEMQHLRHNALQHWPRGMSPWHRIMPCSISAAEMMASFRALAMRRAENAVIEQASDNIPNEALRQLAGMEKREAEKRRDETGSEFEHGGRKIKKNVEITWNNLQLSADDWIRIVEKDELQIAKQIDAPDVIVFGRSDMGARATSDKALLPWWARVRQVARTHQRFDADFLWRALEIKNDWDAEFTRSLQKSYEIVSDDYIDPAFDQQSEHDRALDLLDRNAIDKKQAVQTSGFVFDQEAICEELENQCGFVPVPQIEPPDDDS